jgi:uncharacterized protein YxeA
MKKIVLSIVMIFICCSIAFGASKRKDYDPYWMENDKKLRSMEKSCSKYESMQKDYNEKVWKNENEKQLYINTMNKYKEECQQLKQELMKTLKLKYTFHPYIPTDPYPKWLVLSIQQRKESIDEFIKWFNILNEEEKIEIRSEFLHILPYEYARLNKELNKCEDFDCRMKYTAYISSLKTWFQVIDEMD